MRLILASTPLAGHFGPLLTAAKLLRDAGHEVVFTTAESYRARVESAGLRFEPAMPGAHRNLTDIDMVFPERKNIDSAPQQLRFDVEEVFLKPIPAQLAGLQSMMREFPADVILGDTTFLGALPMILSRNLKQRPIVASLGVVPMTLHRDDGAPFGPGFIPADPKSKEAERYREIGSEIHEALIGPITKKMNEILNDLGCSRLPADLFDSMVLVPDVYMQLGVRSLELPRFDMPERLTFLGNFPVHEEQELSTELIAAIGSGKRLVLVTQGTLINYDLNQLIAPTIQALAHRDDIIVIATTGGRPLDQIGIDLPENTIVSKFLPLYTLLRHASLLVTNGGFGTICWALEHGVPVVSSGEGEEKLENGMRVAHSGVGISLGKLYPGIERLKEAIDHVLCDDRYQRRAQELSAEFHQHNSVAEMVRLLEEAVQDANHLPV